MSRVTSVSLYHFNKNRFWAFKQMGIAPRRFKLTSGLHFFKFLGTGGGEGFSLKPDFSTYALLSVWESQHHFEQQLEENSVYKKYQENSERARHLLLKPIKSHGSWNNQNPFETDKDLSLEDTSPLVIITRATLNWSKLLSFWKSVPKASKAIAQAKGIQYNLADLMAGDSEIVQYFENGNFSCVYLAPHNYHRVHMPYTGKLKAARYIPGELFSVNQLTTRGIKDLYCKNERVVLVFQNESLYFSIIMVGACLVGGIAVLLPNPEGHIQKHIPGIEWTSYFEPHLATPSILRGTEIGYFYFGSTVILLTSRDSPGWLQSLEKDTLVQVGDPLT